MYTLYKLQSPTTDKVYIGCTSKTLHRRLIHHVSQFHSKQERHNNTRAYKNIRKAGLSILDFSIVAITTIENRKEAYIYEEILIKKYRATVGVFNADRSENHWLKGTKGVAKANSGSFQKGEHRSEATQFKNGHESWNKGTKGVMPSTCTGTITIHKDNTNKRINPELLEEYLAQGYKKGMKPRKQAKGYAIQNGIYRPYCTVDGKLRYFGGYATKEECVKVRNKVMLLAGENKDYDTIRAAL